MMRYLLLSVLVVCVIGFSFSQAAYSQYSPSVDMSIENPRVVADSVWVSGGDIIIHWVNSRGPSPAPISNTVGDPVTQVSVGQDVLILADVTKIHPSHKNFAFVVQIQDESGATVSLSWFKTVAYPGFSVPLSSWQPWTPEAAGSYIATIYVKDTVCKTPAYTQIMQDRSSTAAFAVMKDEVATLTMLDEFAFIDGIVTDSYLQGKLDTCSVAETEKGQLDLIKLETDASDQQLLCQLLTCIYQPSLGEDFATPVAFEINVINESSAKPTGLSALVQEETSIPSWIKNTAGWWADGSINDASFLEGISYLIQNDIIVVSSTEAGTGTGGAVPEWVKNTAGWWAADQIDDDVFVNAIQYLIKEGLIQV